MIVRVISRRAVRADHVGRYGKADRIRGMLSRASEVDFAGELPISIGLIVSLAVSHC